MDKKNLHLVQASRFYLYEKVQVEACTSECLSSLIISPVAKDSFFETLFCQATLPPTREYIQLHIFLISHLETQRVNLQFFFDIGA